MHEPKGKEAEGTWQLLLAAPLHVKTIKHLRRCPCDPLLSSLCAAAAAAASSTSFSLLPIPLLLLLLYLFLLCSTHCCGNLEPLSLKLKPWGKARAKHKQSCDFLWPSQVSDSPSSTTWAATAAAATAAITTNMTTRCGNCDGTVELEWVGEGQKSAKDIIGKILENSRHVWNVKSIKFYIL